MVLEVEPDVATEPSGPAAFDDWYRRSHDRLVRALTAVAGDVDLAADAVAEAFARALARHEAVTAMANPDGWVYRTALHVLRRQARRRAVEQRLLRHHRPRDVPPPGVADERLWQAVRSLPGRQREAIALRYLADFAEKDVAAAMGVAEGTASATLAAARRRLSDLLEEPA